ncbi:AI-2E family transporter [Amycolatopsis jiangsuensis]|uniref:Putative PurR-regulated permease PerM n=1 Tax=Amycolatopsis jiangsuensis TaxID=1181879 RepID=A0A840J461_9PSEU|nr:AI-2E family transporter [Amycolatopsis jiangsuensis]MBB4688188.1 putative PurR-regulated permease PerM [Amycolatopsis jiangsuensis]
MNSPPAQRADPQGGPGASPVPYGLRVAAAVSWRLLVVAAALTVLGFVATRLASVVVPVAVALLLAGLFSPAVTWLAARKVPRALATAIVLIVGIALAGGVVTFVVITVTVGMPALIDQVTVSLTDLHTWLRTGPLHLSQGQLDQLLGNLTAMLGRNKSVIASGALTTAVTVGELLAEALLAVFCLIFFLAQGNPIWAFLIRGVPTRLRDRVDIAGRSGFTTPAHYVRGTAAVAFVDAAGIGLGLVILGVPLAAPLSTLVFLGAFIPVIGSVIAGGIAVLVALVANGVWAAVIVLAVVVGVMQVESHVLQPLLLGRAVRLHPLAVVLTLAIGLVTAGIVGALLAVPLLAVISSGVRSLTTRPENNSPAGAAPPADPEDRAPDPGDR